MGDESNSKKILKDKEGNKLTFKEFMAKWKDGIENITPLQKLRTQISPQKMPSLFSFYFPAHSPALEQFEPLSMLPSMSRFPVSNKPLPTRPQLQLQIQLQIPTFPFLLTFPLLSLSS